MMVVVTILMIISDDYDDHDDGFDDQNSDGLSRIAVQVIDVRIIVLDLIEKSIHCVKT